MHFTDTAIMMGIDGNGDETRYTKDSFGIPKNWNESISNAYTYTAREYNVESGDYYYRARTYHQGIGRFGSEDPIGFSGGINYYSYVGNDPVYWSDPFGWCKIAFTANTLIIRTNDNTRLLGINASNGIIKPIPVGTTGGFNMPYIFGSGGVANDWGKKIWTLDKPKPGKKMRTNHQAFGDAFIRLTGSRSGLGIHSRGTNGGGEKTAGCRFVKSNADLDDLVKFILMHCKNERNTFEVKK